MEFASAALAVFIAAFLGLWPFVFLLAVVRHALGKRWQRVGQVAFLLPLWTIAASIGLVKLAPFLAALNDPAPSRSPFVATAAIGFALCCAAVAWALLIRSFGDPPPPGDGQRPAA